MCRIFIDRSCDYYRAYSHNCTLATPQFLFLQKDIVDDSEVQKLIAECFYQRACAMATHQDLVLTLDQLNGTYGTKDRMQSLAHGVRLGFLPRLFGPPSKRHV